MTPRGQLATIPAYQPSFAYYEGEDLISPEQAAEWLKVKLSWVFEQTRQRTRCRSKNPFPCTFVGRYPRFSRRRIAEWLAENSA